MAIKTKKETSVQEFMSWLKEEKVDANNEARGSGSAWNHAYSDALNSVYSKAKKSFGKKAKKSVTKSVKTRLNKKVN